MEIEQHIWGMMPEGEAVILYTMRNASGAEVQISTYGAAIVAVKVPDREGRMDDVVLGYKRFDSYFGDPASLGKTLGRCAGRIAFGCMEIEGQEYRLEPNAGIHHQHGGTKGFGNRLWEGRVETNRVVMSLLSEEGDQGYPGELNVEAIFDFDDDNTLEITYLARTDRTTTVNLACNLGLNLAGTTATGPARPLGTPTSKGISASSIATDGILTNPTPTNGIFGHELQLRSTWIVETDEQGIPIGSIADISGTPRDFRSFRVLCQGSNTPTALEATSVPEHDITCNTEYDITRCTGYDLTYLIDGARPNILTEAATLRDPQSGRCVTVLTSQPCLSVDMGTRLAYGSPEGKSGSRYANHAGIFLTAQHLPNTEGYSEFASTLLQSGELYCQKTVFRFGVYL